MRRVRLFEGLKNFGWALSTSYCLVFCTASSAESSKRLAVVDIDAPGWSKTERDTLLEMLRSKLQRQPIFSVLSKSSIDRLLHQENPRKLKLDQLLLENQKKEREIARQERLGERLYLSSRFDEAIAALNLAFGSLQDASLTIHRELATEILKALAVCHFLKGEPKTTKSFLKFLLDLDPTLILDAQKYPPAFVDLFSALKKEKREDWQIWTFHSNVKGIRAKFLGQALTVEEGSETSIHLPLKHARWNSQPVVLEVSGYAPVILPLDALPTSVIFETLARAPEPEESLFKPSALTPSVELISLLKSLQASVIFLGTAARTSQGEFALSGQWFEEGRNVFSPTVSSKNADEITAVNQLLSELLLYFSAEGHVLNSKRMSLQSGLKSSLALPKAEDRISSSGGSAFYHKWWFWALVGAGAAGAGVGMYFIFRPSSTDHLQLVITKG